MDPSLAYTSSDESPLSPVLESTTKMTSPSNKKTDQNVHPVRRAHSHHCLSWHQAIDPMDKHAVGKHAGVTPIGNRERDGTKDSEPTQV